MSLTMEERKERRSHWWMSSGRGVPEKGHNYNNSDDNG